MRTSPRISAVAPFLFASFLGGCIDPSAQVDGGVQFPEQPPPLKPYQCGLSTGVSCVEPRMRVWVPGWSVAYMTARGNKAAFTAYPNLPTGGVNMAEPQHLGQIDLEKGTVDWVVKLGVNRDDVFSIYDLTIAPNGDVIVAAMGYGEWLIGNKSLEYEGIFASFDSSGKKRFARRPDIQDGQTIPGYTARMNDLRIIANDTIFVQTSHQISSPDQATSARIHLFAFEPTGTQLFRHEVPVETSTYHGTMWPVPDGSMWIKKTYGPFERYSKTGDPLETFSLPPDADFRSFAAMNAKTMLINLTTKGMTNEVHRLDIGTPLVLLFNEPTFFQFHSGEFMHTPDFGKTYFASMNYNGSSERIQSIDANGNRGPATTALNVLHRFGLLESGEAVFARTTDVGTEFIVQQL